MATPTTTSMKNDLTFYLGIWCCSKVTYFVYHCQNYHEIESGTRFTFLRLRIIKSFHVVVLQSIAKKCTKNYNARAQPLFRSLNLLFSDVPVAVAVVVFLNSLNLHGYWRRPGGLVSTVQ